MTKKKVEPRGEVPPFIVDGRIVIRGTREWEARERCRKEAGYLVRSFGTVRKDGCMNFCCKARTLMKLLINDSDGELECDAKS